MKYINLQDFKSLRSATLLNFPDKKEMAKEELIKIRLVKSLIGVPEKHKRVIRALGLKKINSTVVQKNNPQKAAIPFFESD